MKRIIAIGGSSSKNSLNKKFATYVAEQVPNTEIVVVDLSTLDLPLYSIDKELESGISKVAQDLYDLIKSVDGVVISLAEHNGSYSTAFKNALDWLSRINQKLWQNKSMLLLATSPGPRGGLSVLETAKNTFPYLGGNVVADFSLPSFNDNFSKRGLKDSVLNESLNEKISLFEQSI